MNTPEITIDTSLPPNYEAIKAAFPMVADSSSVVFTYGNTIHNPHGAYMRADLTLHESVHARQQRNPAEWWERYLADPEFRLAQEVEAYAEQYHYLRKKLHNTKQKVVLTYLAMDLASECYGCMVDYHKAETLIRHAAHALV